MKTNNIQVRDPFVLPVEDEQMYYLFGTTDTNCWNGEASGFDCYRSRDLENWEGPLPAFRPPAGFAATNLNSAFTFQTYVPWNQAEHTDLTNTNEAVMFYRVHVELDNDLNEGNIYE